MAYLTGQTANSSGHTRLQQSQLVVVFTSALCSHFPRVGLPAAVHLSEAAPADDPMHAEVVHGQLMKDGGEGTLRVCFSGDVAVCYALNSLKPRFL